MSYSIGDGLVTLALAGGIVGYLYISHRSREKKMEIIHRERLVAMEKGIPLPEFPLEPAQARKPPNPAVLPLLGIVLLTLSVGAMIALYLNLPLSAHSSWIFPLPFAFLGVGFIAFHFLSRESGRER